jgi:hypothetical protein
LKDYVGQKTGPGVWLNFGRKDPNQGPPEKVEYQGEGEDEARLDTK